MKRYNTANATPEELALEHALGHVLSSWPQKWHPETVIERIGNKKYKNEISVWEPFEHWSGDDVASEARSIANTLLQFARQMQNIKAASNHASKH